MLQLLGLCGRGHMRAGLPHQLPRLCPPALPRQSPGQQPVLRQPGTLGLGEALSILGCVEATHLRKLKPDGLGAVG